MKLLAALLLATAAFAQNPDYKPSAQWKLELEKGQIQVISLDPDLPSRAVYYIQARYPVSIALVPQESIHRVKTEYDLQRFACYAKNVTNANFGCRKDAAILVLIDSRGRSRDLHTELTEALRAKKQKQIEKLEDGNDLAVTQFVPR